MNPYSSVSQRECVDLLPGTSRPSSELWKLLKAHKFESYDGVFDAERPGRLPIWQSRSLVSAEILLGGKEMYSRSDRWDCLRLSYLMATLPVSCIVPFVSKASALSDALQLPLTWRGTRVTDDELTVRLHEIAQHVRDIIGEPGSEEVRFLLELSYPRK